MVYTGGFLRTSRYPVRVTDLFLMTYDFNDQKVEDEGLRDKIRAG